MTTEAEHLFGMTQEALLEAIERYESRKPGEVASRLRRERRLSLEQVAHELGVSPPALTSFEKEGLLGRLLEARFLELRHTLSEEEEVSEGRRLIARYFDLLQPNAKEKEELLYDHEADLLAITRAVRNGLHPEITNAWSKTSKADGKKASS